MCARKGFILALICAFMSLEKCNSENLELDILIFRQSNSFMDEYFKSTLFKAKHESKRRLECLKLSCSNHIEREGYIQAESQCLK